jgi:hypothetical protein
MAKLVATISNRTVFVAVQVQYIVLYNEQHVEPYAQKP